MRRSLHLAMALLPLAVAPIPALAQYRNLEFSEKREGNASAAGANRIVIDARAGSLRVTGKSGSREVRATGTAHATTKDLLDDVRLTTERRGDQVVVLVDIPENDRWDDDMQALLDLTVEVPDTIALEIEDSSGEVEVIGVGGVEIVDGSGALVLENVGGALTVRDGSGEVRIEKVRGDVRVRDGSGEIEVREVTGSVIIEADGSGEIDVDGVTGRVHVESDGSGSINARNVGGDFVVDRKGSGGIRYRDVKGDVQIPRNKRADY